MRFNNREYLNHSGIYAIYSKIDGSLYIGSALNLRKRRTHHVHLLRNNKHYSIYLQNIYNKYGEENLSFQIIEIVSGFDNYSLSNNLILREQFYISLLKPNFNTIMDIKVHNIGFKHKESTIEKLKSFKHTDEQIKKMKVAQLGSKHIKSKPVMQFDKNGNFIKRWINIQSVREGGYDPTAISRCCHGRRKFAYRFIWKFENDSDKIKFNRCFK